MLAVGCSNGASQLNIPHAITHRCSIYNTPRGSNGVFACVWFSRESLSHLPFVPFHFHPSVFLFSFSLMMMMMMHHLLFAAYFAICFNDICLKKSRSNGSSNKLQFIHNDSFEFHVCCNKILAIVSCNGFFSLYFFCLSFFNGSVRWRPHSNLYNIAKLAQFYCKK